MYVSDKKAEKVYTSARKQMLISALPPVVTLHLKRFHQVFHSLNLHTSFVLHKYIFVSFEPVCYLNTTVTISSLLDKQCQVYIDDLLIFVVY